MNQKSTANGSVADVERKIANKTNPQRASTQTEYAEKTFCGHRNMVELLLIYEFGGKGSHESWS